MSTGMVTTTDGTQIFYKDWGGGQPVVFSHGWPLTADAWDDQMWFVVSNGFRAIAHDRRGHGRSSQPWEGNDMDTYADDLAAVDRAARPARRRAGRPLHRRRRDHPVHGRHGTDRVAKAVLVGAIPPLMLQTDANPEGLPRSVFDGLRANVERDRSQSWKDLSAPFYGANRDGSTASQGLRDAFWLMGMTVGFKAAYDCIKVFSETDQTEDCRKIDVPTLIIHGDDDQIVPIGASAMKSSKLIKDSMLHVYKGAPHGLTATHQDDFNADLLAFLKA